MTLNDIYRNLFGKDAIENGNVIDFAEHGRIGNLSTGEGFKKVRVLDDDGNFINSFGATSTPTAANTGVSGATTSAILLPLNADRKHASFYNASTGTLYILLGTSATYTAFTAKLFPEDYYEVFSGYNGYVSGVWDAKAGACYVSEV